MCWFFFIFLQSDSQFQLLRQSRTENPRRRIEKSRCASTQKSYGRAKDVLRPRENIRSDRYVCQCEHRSRTVTYAGGPRLFLVR